MSSIPDCFDPSAAFSTLSLALEFWTSLDQIQKLNNDNVKRNIFIDEAFDVMLLLPDCVASNVGSEKEGRHETSTKNMDDDETKATDVDIDVATRTIDQLQRIEEFVNEQTLCINSSNTRPNDELKVIQYFLPSLARISYKVLSYKFPSLHQF